MAEPRREGSAPMAQRGSMHGRAAAGGLRPPAARGSILIAHVGPRSAPMVDDAGRKVKEQRRAPRLASALPPALLSALPPGCLPSRQQGQRKDPVYRPKVWREGRALEGNKARWRGGLSRWGALCV